MKLESLSYHACHLSGLGLFLPTWRNDRSRSSLSSWSLLAKVAICSEYSMRT